MPSAPFWALSNDPFHDIFTHARRLLWVGSVFYGTGTMFNCEWFLVLFIGPTSLDASARPGGRFAIGGAGVKWGWPHKQTKSLAIIAWFSRITQKPEFTRKSLATAAKLVYHPVNIPKGNYDAHNYVFTSLSYDTKAKNRISLWPSTLGMTVTSPYNMVPVS